jgi:hypothetical protein
VSGGTTVAGAVHETTACALVAVAVTLVGAAGEGPAVGAVEVLRLLVAPVLWGLAATGEPV